ncbi:MAG: aminoacyl-tRNA hydrolase [Prevotellaceae bacterium]|nr:aminoacyl-tRNA hydrolase [Prevotellaceae bacterium]
MKYLIAGLGNVGDDYAGTRHNVGFRVVNALAEEAGAQFADKRYGLIAKMRVKNRELTLLKPSTLMNLSGNAVRFWLGKENIPLENLLVVCDDLSLPLGTIRMKPSGSAAGHNGLKHIAQTLGTEAYARLRVGIGSDFPRGGQIDFVLGRFPEEDEAVINQKVKVAAEAVKAFALSGVQFAMNQYNGK